ncbi:MAG: hypothetical protein M3P06_05400 [Acidobacteriota bacterium]|nr:hypothetical protein [Acidobacteriota bacterium]
MVSRRAVSAFFLVQLLAFAVSAQESAEFGRANGGEFVLKPKGPSALSGSLAVSTGDVFGQGGAPRYGLTAGGTLLQDRLWFFASASQQDASPTPFAELELPENAPASATTAAAGARVNAQLAGGHDLSAFFEAARRPQLSTTGSSVFADIAPSSFLSLRYTGIVTNNMFFNASVTRSSRTVQGFGIVPAE